MPITLQEFIKKWTGKVCDYDGYYGTQCMDLMHFYHVEVLGIKENILSAPSAKIAWQNSKSDTNFTKINNSPTNVPQAGDIIFWDSGQYGHVAIFVDGDVMKFNSFDANWPTGSLPHIQSHDYTGVAGWLRPKKSISNLKMGIDISMHQNVVNYDDLKKAVNFVILKATEGDGFQDKKFTEFQRNLKSKNVLLGYYHFARPDLNNTPEAEAKWFLSVIGEVSDNVLVLDFEVQYTKAVDWCLKWLDYVFKETKVKPLIYLNQSQTKAVDWKPIIEKGYGLWLAQYDYSKENPPIITQWDKVSIKQYSNQENVAGISNVVDANVLYVEWSELTKKYEEQKSELEEMRESRNKWKSIAKERENIIADLEKEKALISIEREDLKKQVSDVGNKLKTLVDENLKLTDLYEKCIQNCGNEKLSKKLQNILKKIYDKISNA